ncbi:hypothetical protein [Inquilinus ginsengisoli]|uniref:hypothetical protein n=1 Tax=Inquilinus ginsengisoli TaxID=363840 RepID=UPI003D1A1B2A
MTHNTEASRPALEAAISDFYAAPPFGSDAAQIAQQAKAAGRGFVADHFDQIDTSGKGYVTLGEVSQFMAQRSPQKLMQSAPQWDAGAARRVEPNRSLRGERSAIGTRRSVLCWDRTYHCGGGAQGRSRPGASGSARPADRTCSKACSVTVISILPRSTRAQPTRARADGPSIGGIGDALLAAAAHPCARGWAQQPERGDSAHLLRIAELASATTNG